MVAPNAAGRRAQGSLFGWIRARNDPRAVRQCVMHPWHAHPVDEAEVAESFPAVIQVPMGDKLLTVCIGDPAFADYRDFRELPKHVVRETERFFEDYKALEGKRVSVDELLGPGEAVRILTDALRHYRESR